MKRIRSRQLRTSRGLLTATGLLLLALAVLGALLASGAVGSLGRWFDSDTTVLNAAGRSALSRHELTYQLVGAALGLLLILVGLVWLRNQIPPVRHQEDLRTRSADPAVPGYDVIRGGAWSQVLQDDLERSDTVSQARCQFLADHNLIRLRLDVDETVPVHQVLTSVVDPAIDRVTAVAGLASRPNLELDLRPVERERHLV